MITHEIYSRVRNGICAIGYLTEPLKVYLENMDKPIFQVIGTGFLIEETLVLTNRHVINDLLDDDKTNFVPNTQLFIQFVVPHQGSILQIVPRMIREVSWLDHPKLDLGFIKYKTVHEAHFVAIQPLVVSEQWDLKVTESIAVCGYPYGTTILNRDIYQRWGPVVQQGNISAISPFDTTATPDEILSDVRTASGMSGAPIFRPDDGKVIGVHYAGIEREATIAFGIPITQAMISDALTKYQLNLTILNEG